MGSRIVSRSWENLKKGKCDDQSLKYFSLVLCISQLQFGFSERLDHLDWLDGNTRSAIRKKVGRTSELFGYPDFIFNSSELDRVYEDLYVTEDEYLENQVSNFPTLASKDQVGVEDI